MGITDLLLGASTPDYIVEDSTLSALCADPAAEHLLRKGAYCKILLDRNGWSEDAINAATRSLKSEMTLVPAGETVVQPLRLDQDAAHLSSGHRLPTEAFLVDRFAVTQAQFERFVSAGGYRQEEFWPEDILPLVLQFVDQSGNPGPRFWSDGEPDPGQRDHPVVGISWYEANAYALWVGKQLPTSAQWQRAGTWWRPDARYPWGNSFENGRANLAALGGGNTLPVDSLRQGATPNGIHQLVGNVWEWVYASVDHIEVDNQLMPIEQPLGEIRGGAFDTYLVTQATCQFRSGLPLLDRTANVGFRCAVSPEVIAAS